MTVRNHNIQLQNLVTTDTPSPCKGRVYRGTRNTFTNTKGQYIEKQTMTPLKRLSCPGCECCRVFDDLADFVSDGYLLATQIEDKALYHLGVTNISYDWETGDADDYEITFIKNKI